MMTVNMSNGSALIDSKGRNCAFSSRASESL